MSQINWLIVTVFPVGGRRLFITGGILPPDLLGADGKGIFSL